MKNAVIITGSNGGIGAALKEKFAEEGYAVIGLGRSPDTQQCDEYIQVDFAELATNVPLQADFGEQLKKILLSYSLKGLINNSAVQILARLDNLSIEDFQKTLNVNLVVPFILSKLCLESLSQNDGSILNIGSIHAKLTKEQFVAYATSKGALETMTKAMAVDIGSKVRVNLIAPAAIETEMLRAGFEGNAEAYQGLAACHPSNRIGTPAEVANMAHLLITGVCKFLNGAVIDVTGGIHARLYDLG